MSPRSNNPPQRTNPAVERLFFFNRSLLIHSPPASLLATAWVFLYSSGCADGEAQEDTGPSVVEGEWLPGGDTTNTRLLGSNAFLMPAQNLTPENELAFYGGNGFFNQGWVEAPASTEARDGLGPFFNARSCSGCHFRDGKAAPPDEGSGPFVGLLLRLSVPGPEGPVPEPVYGNQLQDQANPDLRPEGLASVTWRTEEGHHDDGTPYSLVRPVFALQDPTYGAFSSDLMTSPRIAPHMIGLGLLEAITSSRLLQLEDPEDADEDGISGRLQWHTYQGEEVPGRFGWKAEAPNLEVQSSAAFSNDMGLTTSLHPQDDCTEGQPDCLKEPNGGEPEVDEHIFGRVVHYSRTVAVPVRRAADDRDVLQGKKLFRDLNCHGCHTASHTTGESTIEELSHQLIWPYTDLLLHDMGPGLADGRPVGEASGQEWKTPPLWGLGLMSDVSNHTRYLHDGRARNLEEAILWHGGEAQASRDGFMALSSKERAQILKFLGDL